MSHNSCCHEGKDKWYKNRLLIVLSVLGGLCLLSSIFPILVPFRQTLLVYVKIIWWAILVGLILGGVIDQLIPREHISYFLARKEKRSIINAVFLGFLMTACCHGILAIAIQLHKKGASTPAVIAFLLASPWANMPLTIMLVGLFGLIKALYIILVAIIIALTTGFIYQYMETKGIIESNQHSLMNEDGFSVGADIKQRWKAYRLTSQRLMSDAKGILNGSISLANMVLWWILLGMGLASLIGAYVPTQFIQTYMGPSVGGLFTTLAVATVMEVCSEGTAPVAFELYRQTNAIGNSFVFLMGGVVTDYTEIGLIWHNVGRKAAIWLPVLAVPQVILYGIIANILFA